MNYLKKLIVGIALLSVMGISSLKADTVMGTISGINSNQVLLTGPAKINNITVISSSGVNGLISFFDSPFGTNTYSIGVFTNYTKQTMTTNITYTNIFGVVTTNSYSTIVFTTNTLTAGLRTRPLILNYTTVSNTAAAFDFNGTYIGQGLLVTNIATAGGAPGSITISIDYDKLR